MVEDILKNIFWMGHDGFRIDGDKIIYIDPFKISANKKADIILISHDHFDHCSPEDIESIVKEDTIIVTEKDSAGKLKGDVRIVKPGDTISIGDIMIEAVPAYNLDKDFHPKENGWLGFILELKGVRIYHTGDSDFIPEMKELKTDIALIPVSGTYVMTAEQAIEAALAIQPQVAIPMHYGAIVGDDKDADRFKEGLEGKVDVRILQKS